MHASADALRDLLKDAGYDVAVRHDVWWDCYVHHNAERVIGRGLTEAEAVGDAIAQLLPSHLARVLLDKHLAEARAPAAARTAEVSIITAGAAVEPQAAPAVVITMGPQAAPNPAPGFTMGPQAAPNPAPGFTMGPQAAPNPAPPASAPITMGPQAAPNPASPAALVASHSPDVQAAVTSHSAGASHPAGVQAAASAVESTLREVVATAAPVEAAPPVEVAEPPSPRLARRIEIAPARQRPAEALETVEKLLANIEERLGHLARMCADRQRLNMLVWICRARAVEEAMPGVRDVEHAVARVARRLTEIGKMFWPGSVRALQLSARPADVRREMHATWASEPNNWIEATNLAERLLGEHLGKSVDLGLDEDGWADGALRQPPPTEPDTLFEEVDAELKKMLVPPGEVPNGRVGELSAAELDQLVTAARRLRWLRGAVKDDVAWGVAMGRLRRAVPSLGDRAGRVRDVLENRFKPSATWAKILGEREADAPESTVTESPAKLTADLPAARESKDALMAWLIRAFDVLNTPELVPLMLDFKPLFATFTEEELNHPDRRVRRRLRDLVKRLAESAAPPPKDEPKEEPEEPTQDDATQQHALAALSERVRAHTVGRRALFVSNRDDPELGSRLSELLGITITWCDGSLRRVQAQCERISRGSYDLVLSATGFQVHGVDTALARASSAAGIAYVRVNRGRPAACVQAIAREFGLLSQDRVAATPPKAVGNS